MLQQKTPDDYVIATGVTHSIRYFAETASSILGINLEWRGENMEEVAIDKATSKPFITINPKYFRPAEVDILRGNPQKAIERSNWVLTRLYSEGFIDTKKYEKSLKVDLKLDKKIKMFSKKATFGAKL